MMQALGISLDIIERCQNHVLSGSKVRRDYMFHDYADEKRAAWAALGRRLSPPHPESYLARKGATHIEDNSEVDRWPGLAPEDTLLHAQRNAHTLSLLPYESTAF